MELADMRYCIYSIVGEDKTGLLLSQVNSVFKVCSGACEIRGRLSLHNLTQVYTHPCNGLLCTVHACPVGLTV